MKILCLTDFPVRSPDDRWIWNYLPDQDDDVDFLWADPNDQSARWGKILTRYPSYWRLSWQALKQLSRQEYDVMVAWESKVGIPMALLRWLTRRYQPPFVILAFASGYVPSLFFPIVRLGLRAVDHVTLLTRSEVSTYRRLFGLSPSKTSLSPLATYDALDVTRQQCEIVGQGQPSPYIHASGRTARDYATLFRAVADLDVRLVVHGPAYCMQGLEIPKNVQVGEFVPLDRYQQLVYGALFEVVPLKERVQHPAGASQVVLSMMMGKPVVATRTASLEEFVEEGETGILVEQGDYAGMRQAISFLLEHPGEARRMGQNARHRFVKHYDFPVFARRTHEVLCRVYQARQSPGDNSVE